MFDKLTSKIYGVLGTISGKKKLTKDDIDKGLKEIRIALLEADVNLKVVKEFINRVKEKAEGQQIIKHLDAGSMLVKIVNEEMISLLGEKEEDIEIENTPYHIALVGLQGSGKTTTAGKLGQYIKNKYKHNVLLVPCDIKRPAAKEQLKIVAEKAELLFADIEMKNIKQISSDALKIAKEYKADVIIYDTAGRLHIDEEMMSEVKILIDKVEPNEVLFVGDGMTGQDMLKSANKFNEELSLTGLIITKLDGDARGGALLSAKYITGKPVRFIGTGEKVTDFELFYPDRMASRILGMGDVLSLIEKAESLIEEEEAKKLEEKIRKNTFDYGDFLKQLKMIKKMGPIKDIVKMIPGVAPQLKNVPIDDSALKKVEAIILSMTREERQNPRLMKDMSRRRRIAKGSGNTVGDVNKFVDQFRQMQKMMKKMGNQFPMN